MFFLFDKLNCIVRSWPRPTPLHICLFSLSKYSILDLDMEQNWKERRRKTNTENRKSKLKNIHEHRKHIRVSLTHFSSAPFLPPHFVCVCVCWCVLRSPLSPSVSISTLHICLWLIRIVAQKMMFWVRICYTNYICILYTLRTKQWMKKKKSEKWLCAAFRCCCFIYILFLF